MLILDWASFTLGFICGVSIALLIVAVAGYMLFVHELTQENPPLEADSARRNIKNEG